jgi:hypothetical protein
MEHRYDIKLCQEQSLNTGMESQLDFLFLDRARSKQGVGFGVEAGNSPCLTCRYQGQVQGARLFSFVNPLGAIGRCCLRLSGCHHAKLI